MPDNSALHAEASNPTTDPARLAAIAHEDPTLGAIVANNPAAYDGLLDWLLQYGDEAAKQAVAARRGAPAAPAPAAVTATSTMAPVAPVGYAPAATVKAPMSPALKKGLLFGGIGVAAIAVLAVSAVVVVNVLGGSSSSGIRIMDIGNEPRDDAWGILTPMLDDNDLDSDSALQASAHTVGQDRALVGWSAYSSEDDPVGDGLLSLIDTKNGSVLWTVDWDDDFEVISAPGATPYLLSVYDEDDGFIVYSIDAGNGDVISDTTGLDNAGVYALNSLGVPLGGLGGDVIVRSDDGIGRYSPSDFDSEKWLIEIDDDEVPSVVGNRIIVGKDAYSIQSGEEVDWNADDDISFYDFGGHIIGSDGSSSDDATITLYDDSGEEQWSYDLDGSNLVFADGDLLLLGNTDDETLISLDLGSGEEVWTADVDEGYTVAGGSVESGVMVLTSYDDDEGRVVDLATGDEISSFDLNGLSTVLGVTKNFVYLSGGRDDDLDAVDVRTGDEAWSLNNPGEYYYSLLGGNIVGIQTVQFDDAEDDALVIGIQP